MSVSVKNSQEQSRCCISFPRIIGYDGYGHIIILLKSKLFEVSEHVLHVFESVQLVHSHGQWATFKTWFLALTSPTFSELLSQSKSQFIHQQAWGDNLYPIKWWRGLSQILCVMICLAQHPAQGNTYSVHGGEAVVIK